jgi:hypothetical protein
MKHLSALVILFAGIACGTTTAMAESAPSSARTVKKAPAKKTSAEKQEARAEDDEPSIVGLHPVAFECELGNKLTIYGRETQDDQIALQWNKTLHRMQRVGTTTGAHRFENMQNGLVWIGIPAKGMLLDSKKGKQLANECRNPEQAAPRMVEKG